MKRKKIRIMVRMRFFGESHIESIEEVSVVEESVSEKEVEENDEQVQDFAEDEPAKIYVVPGWWGAVYKCHVGDRGIYLPRKNI